MDHRPGLPVALGTEAVSVRHQSLNGESGELAQAAEVLEVGGEPAEAAVVEEGAQAGLDAGGVAKLGRSIAAGA